MDRSDDKQDHRTGDVLGLGGISSGDGAAPHASQDPEEVRKRRARMQEGADEMTSVTSEVPRGGGATGIDMGAGGDGTDIE